MADNGTCHEKNIDRGFLWECVRANELGDGAMFAELHRDRFVFASDGAWLRWSGHHWAEDRTERALAAVDKVAEEYLNEVNRILEENSDVKDWSSKENLTPEQSKALENMNMLRKRAWKVRSVAGRKNCLEFARTLPNVNGSLVVDSEDIDKKPLLFACANGVMDLSLGKFSDGLPSDYLFRHSKVPWKGFDEPAPLWEKTLLEIFGGQKTKRKDGKEPIDIDPHQIVAFVQRLIGYMATGLVHEKMFPVLYGPGGWNGKSKFIEAIAAVFGGYAKPIPSEMLLEQKYARSSSGPSPDLLILKGLRMAYAAETARNRKLSADAIKRLTGGDTIPARGINAKHFTDIDPTHKLVLSTNYLPGADGDDAALWNRMVAIPFMRSFVLREPEHDHEFPANKYLDVELRSEYSGILAWIFKGSIDYLEMGMAIPEFMIEFAAEWQKDEDMLLQWVDACCNVDPKVWDDAKTLYASFVEWYKENWGDKPPAQKTFGASLSRRFERRKVGTYRYYGLKVSYSVGGSE